MQILSLASSRLRHNRVHFIPNTRILKATLQFLLLLSLALSAGCGGGATRQLVSLAVQPTTAAAYAPTGNSVFTATATFDRNPLTEDNFAAQWSSSNTAIAAVDATGNAICLTAGDVTITASNTGGMIRSTAALTCLTTPPPSSGHCLVNGLGVGGGRLTGSCGVQQSGTCMAVSDSADCPTNAQAIRPTLILFCQPFPHTVIDIGRPCTP
jgi:hypothetical protein